MKQKTISFLRWIPSAVIIVQVSTAAVLKFSGNAFMVKQFTDAGLINYMPVFATMELLFVALFIWPHTLHIGLLLLTTYFGGAIAVEMMMGNPLIPAVVLCIIWLAAWLREPAIFKLPITVKTGLHYQN